MSDKLNIRFSIEVKPGCPECRKLPNFARLMKEYFEDQPRFSLVDAVESVLIEAYIDEIKEHVCARVKFLPKSVVVKRTSPKRAQKR